jgi:hypothetical protein
MDQGIDQMDITVGYFDVLYDNKNNYKTMDKCLKWIERFEMHINKYLRVDRGFGWIGLRCT